MSLAPTSGCHKQHIECVLTWIPSEHMNKHNINLTFILLLLSETEVFNMKNWNSLDRTIASLETWATFVRDVVINEQTDISVAGK